MTAAHSMEQHEFQISITMNCFRHIKSGRGARLRPESVHTAGRYEKPWSQALLQHGRGGQTAGGRQITMERAEEYTKPERSKPTKKGGDNERGQMNGHRWAAGEEGREGGKDYTKDWCDGKETAECHGRSAKRVSVVLKGSFLSETRNSNSLMGGYKPDQSQFAVLCTGGALDIVLGAYKFGQMGGWRSSLVGTQTSEVTIL